MATVTERVAVLAWVIGKMQADSVLVSNAVGGIYDQLAPDLTPSPFVVINPPTLSDVLTATDDRAYQSGLWTIKAVGKVADMAKIIAICVRFDALFGKTLDVDTNAMYLICHREGEMIPYREVVGGEMWEHDGAMFRIGAQLK